MAETSWVLFQGALIDDQFQDFAAASYARLVTKVTLKANIGPAAAGGAIFRLKVNGTLQAQVFTLPQGDVSEPIVVDTGGLQLAAGATLTAVVTTAGGVENVAFWIESSAFQTGTPDTWVVPTAADIQVAISAPEWEAFTSSVLTTGQADPIPAIIRNCVAEIRSAIWTGKKTKLGQDGTIPSGAVNLFLDGSQWTFFKRVKAASFGKDTLTELKKQWDEGLKAIREGDVAFEEPEDPSDTDVIESGAWGSNTYIEFDSDPHYVGTEEP